MRAKVATSTKKGEIICPFVNVEVYKDGKIVFNGQWAEHSDTKFNAIAVRGFLIAMVDLQPDDGIKLNVNQFRYLTEFAVGRTQCALASDDAASHGDNDEGSLRAGEQPPLGFCHLSDAAKQRLYDIADETVRECAVRDGFTPTLACEGRVAVLPTATKSLHGECRLATFAKETLQVGDVVFDTSGLLMPFPLRSTVALPDDKHLRLAGGAEFLRHSCQPNLTVVIEGTHVKGIAARPIFPGEMLTYNYLTTEWDIARPFRCSCNVFSCYGLIQGFKHLDPEQQQHLLPTVSPAVLQKFRFPMEDFARLSRNTKGLVVAPNSKGDLAALGPVAAGTILFPAQRYRFGVRELFVDSIRLPHSCDANTVIVEGRLLARFSLSPGEVLTVNVSLLAYQIPVPFSCNCQSPLCAGIVDGFQSLPLESKDLLMSLTEPSVRVDAVRNGYVVGSSCALVSIAANGDMGQATFAAQSIAAGTRFFRTAGLVIPYPTMYTILLAENKHLLFAGGAQCLAHSCDPNVRIVVDPSNSNFECVALRDISPGELIAFNYLTTEWDMSAPFPCLCGAPQCHRDIRGFKYRNEQERQRLWFSATPAIRALASRDRPDTVLGALDRATVMVDCAGVLCSVGDTPSGRVLLTCERFLVRGEGMLLEDAYVAHSCDANAFLVLGKLVTARALSAGEPITVNVNVTNYEVPVPFVCHCGAATCCKDISGFRHLSDRVKHQLMIYVDPVVRVLALNEGYRLESDCKLVDIRDNGDVGQTTFAATRIAKGTRFFRSTGLVIGFPTMYTILLSPGRNLLFAGGAHCLAHSCEPNVQVVVDPNGNSFDLVALRDILPNEVVSFNYLTTEWDMSVSFPCLCGAPNCFHMIRGFKHLSQPERRSLAPLATAAVMELADYHSEVHLSPLLQSNHGVLFAAKDIPKHEAILACATLEVCPAHLNIGRYILRHSADAFNVILVENHLVTCRAVAAHEPLLVNMALFVYDMCKIFPDTFLPDNRGFKHLDEAQKQSLLYLCEPPVRAQAMRDGWRVVSTNPAVVVQPNGDMGQTAFAAVDIARGTVLFETEATRILFLPFPTMYTICVGEGRHVLFGDAAECIAHSCAPNVQVHVHPDGTMSFVALTDVSSGSMLSFCYNSTEWTMNSPFPCLCGSEKCVRVVRGFKYLADEDRQRIWSIATDHIHYLASLGH